MSPIRFCALLFATGILLIDRLQISHSVIPFLGLSGFLCIFIFILCAVSPVGRFISLHRLRQSSLLYIALFLSGGYLYFVHIAVPPTHIARSAPYDTPITIAGEIHRLSNKHTYAELHVIAHKMYADTLAKQVRGKFLVRISDSLSTLVPGDRVLLAGQMSAVSGKRNPADFDYRRYLAQSNIYSVFYADQWTTLHQTATILSRIRGIIAQFRLGIQSAIQHTVPDKDTSALLQALLLGETSLISSSSIESFRKAGLSHLLAVSGLHVLCIGLILYSLARPVCLRIGLRWHSMEITRIFLTLSILLTYLCITSFKPAVFRATVMTSIFIVAPLFQRPVASINNLFIAAGVLLSINPLYLFQPGFQLSFAAASSIIHFYPRLPTPNVAQGFIRKITQYLVSSWNVSLAALIGTLPISLYYFHMTSPGALLLNVAAIPATTGILLSGFLIVLSYPMSIEMAHLFGLSAQVFSASLLFVTEQGASLLPTFSTLPSPPLKKLYLISGIVVFLIAGLSIRLSWKSVCILLFVLVPIQWHPILMGAHYPRLDVLFFDVGHGDAALVTFPNGRTMIIDTGDVPWKPEAHVLVDHLHQFNVGCIDAIVLTHPDRDHIGGLSGLLEAHCIHTIYTSGDNRFSKARIPLNQSDTLIAGDYVPIDARVSVRVLSPPLHLIDKANSNEGSVVLEIQYGTTRFLFLGDAEQGAEEHLVQVFPGLLPSQVVKVGHHGSSTSSSLSLVQSTSTLNLRRAVISTGKQSRYGLPDSEVVVRWQNSGAIIHNTAESGALLLSSDGRTIREVK